MPKRLSILIDRTSLFNSHSRKRNPIELRGWSPTPGRKQFSSCRFPTLLLTIRVPSHVSGMRCVFTQTHESERDSSISASLSLSWFYAKTQRIPDTWDGTLILCCEAEHEAKSRRWRRRMYVYYLTTRNE